MVSPRVTISTSNGSWPSLPLAEWRDTCATLQLWTQIAGKVRLALAPMANHWWQVPLYVTVRGLTTARTKLGWLELTPTSIAVKLLSFRE